MSHPLYPKITPYEQSWLATDDGHQLYLEQSGNANGIPVVYLHGGPGAGSNENNRRYFDPEMYRIIQFDQRGCGRSEPAPATTHNTLWHLVDDIERIRKHLGIDRWLVCGGSWGTTLALAYGVNHHQNILGFILRGIFLGAQSELDWLYQREGANGFFPEYYQEFIGHLPEEMRHDPLQGYQQLLTSENELAVIAASKAWYLWEQRLSTLVLHPSKSHHVADPHQALCMAKISSHYFNQRCFLTPNFLLKNLFRISHLPAIILHGRYDMVCQLQVAQQLAKHWPNAQLQILPQAGHSGFEQQTIDAFCKAANAMADFIAQQPKN